MSEGPRTIAYGIGAAKCGTTWVNRYLRAHPQVSCLSGEVHYWDSVRPPHIAKYRINAERRLKKVRPGDVKYEARRRLVRMHQEPSVATYLDVLGLERPAAPVWADISPTYGTVSADTFREMQGIAPQTRFFLILRDPVDRWFSACHYWVRRSGKDTVTQDDVLARLAVESRGNKLPKRCRYDLTLAAADAGIAPENLLVLFYEDLFRQDSIDKLCDHLGIDRRTADTGTRINAAPADGPRPSAAFEARALALLGPVYMSMKKRFGADLPDAWRG